MDIGSVINTGRIVFLTLFVSNLAVIFLRYDSHGNRREFFLFALIVVFIGVKNMFPRISVFGVMASLALVLVAGNLLFTLKGVRFHYLWNISTGLHAVVIIALMSAGAGHTVCFSLYYCFIVCVLLFHPMHILFDLYKKTHRGVFLYLLICSVLLMFARPFDFLCDSLSLGYIDTTLWVSIFFLCGIGYMLFHEGYLLKEELYGFHAKLGKKEKKLSEALSRVARTEHTLVVQDRLAAASLLAAGTTHEFKNMLANLKILSQYGLIKHDVKRKDEILSAVLELAQSGSDMVSRFIDTITHNGRQTVCRIDLKEDLFQFFKLVRTTYRQNAVLFTIDVEEGCAVFAGKSEIEQIIFNLIRNSVESVKTAGGSEKHVGVTIRRIDGHVVIDVTDNGAGVPEGSENIIFEPHFSGRQSTGIGLYIVKEIVRKNMGHIEYIACDNGACFRVVFPAA
ncbi:MAG: HAMP domain-containing histidine kinase [Spirochaetales bacterium]|nr:HAMP domain-containing histidine kinase [Spirochaetales bacterium]